MDQALESIIRLESDNQQKLKAVCADLERSFKQHNPSRDRLYKRRQELVSGKSTPTAEELSDYSAPDDSSSVAAAGHKSMPYFWLNALYNQDALAEEISSRDKLALAHCTSVKTVYPAAGVPPTLEMSFSSNPFFSNNTLRRCLGDEDLRLQPITTDIQWKDTAHKLTVKEVKKGGGKKTKKGSKGKSPADDVAGSGSTVRIRPCASFFRFFLPEGDSSNSHKSSKVPKHLHDPVAVQDDEQPEDEDDEDSSGQKSAKAERDELIMRLITEEVLPKAAELYLSGPLQSLDSAEDDEGDGYQLVHGAAGLDPAELLGPVQPLLAALRHNQAQIDALQAERASLQLKAKQQEEQLRKVLSQQRREILLPPGSSSTIVPRFWLRVLRSADAAALAVSPRDAAVLAHLADVRFSLVNTADAGKRRDLHGKLELDFLPNMYLKSDNTMLSKEYSFELTAGGESYLSYSKVAAAPAWSSAELDPTHKKCRDGKQRPASSIFQLFKQGGGKYAFNLSGSEKEVQAEANELETELLMELHAHLLNKAGTIYKQLSQEGWAEGDSPKGDEAAWQHKQHTEAEESESEAGEAISDDEGEAAHRAAARRAKQKQNVWRVTKAGVLMGFIALILLAEVSVFLDMTGLFGRAKQ